MTYETRHPRMASIDIVRILGTIAVVAGHVWDNDSIRSLLYPWHVPLFFFLTGYLWTEGRSLKAEIVRRCHTLLVPYIGWLVLVTVTVTVLTSIWPRTDEETALLPLLAGGSFLSRPYSAFWFITALFFATVVARLLEKLPSWAGVLIILSCMAASHFFGKAISKLPLSMGIGIVCIAFIGAGYMYRLHRHRIRHPVLLSITLTALGVLTIALRISQPMDLKHGNFGTPLLSFAVSIGISIAILTFAELATRRLPSRINQKISEFASVGLMVILSHSLVLWLADLTEQGNFWIFVVALVAPWITGLFVLQSPLAKLLLGVRGTSIQAPRHRITDPT